MKVKPFALATVTNGRAERLNVALARVSLVALADVQTKVSRPLEVRNGIGPVKLREHRKMLHCLFATPKRIYHRVAAKLRSGFSALIKHGKMAIQIEGNDFAITTQH